MSDLRRRRSRAGAARVRLAGAALLAALASQALVDAREVQRVILTVPLPARLPMEGVRTVLVTRLIIDRADDQVDINGELVPLMRRQLRRRSNLEILDVEPPALPEQPIRELIANTGFWRRMASAHGADLIITGLASFEVSDRSGFIQTDEISPLTGQRVTRTRFVDREGILLDLNLFFIRGATGRLDYENHLTAQDTIIGQGHDRLTTLFVMFEQIEDDVMGILVPGTKTVQRYLFTD